MLDRSGSREHEENKEATNYDGSHNEPTAIRTPSIVAGAIAVVVVRAIRTPNVGHELARLGTKPPEWWQSDVKCQMVDPALLKVSRCSCVTKARTIHPVR